MPVTVMSKDAPPAIIGPGRMANFPSDLAETAKPSDLESEALRNASRDGGEHSVKIFGVLIAQDEPCGL
jgi:hypothetical protein